MLLRDYRIGHATLQIESRAYQHEAHAPPAP
jgi:hypothetical protein